MQVIADNRQFGKMYDRLVEEVGAAMRDKDSTGPWAFVGLRSHGDVIARRLADQLKPEHHGILDIAFYRDDLSEVAPQLTVRPTEMDFPMDGTNVLLVDDVLMSGRTIRAALQSLIDFGRPRVIRLLVLVDRGERELPIAPDFTGMTYTAHPDQKIEVQMKPTDAADRIVVGPRESTDAEST